MSRAQAAASLLIICASVCVAAQQGQSDDTIRNQLQEHEFDLSTTGKAFLIDEQRAASFFLLGELHGENEIPALIRELWPEMWRDGYRHIAGEMSPWAANQLEFGHADSPLKVEGLWSKQEAVFVHSLGASGQSILWGCDMEEMQPHILIAELARENPSNQALQRMMEITKSGYNRTMAPTLLQLMPEAHAVRDVWINDVSLFLNLKATLEIESDRLNPEVKLRAQLRRESLMKDLFLLHYQRNVPAGSESKVMLRFGRNHLHRGYDERGVSTLGNFIAEFAFAQHRTAFNVAAFGAGGKASLAGETWDADERNDDLAFQLLASLARFPATVFDLRPLRQVLHSIPVENRSALQTRLIFWADSYDAIICYKKVTPLHK
jgi:hypothetical protein